MLEETNKKWSQFKYCKLGTTQCSCLSPQTHQGDWNNSNTES